MRINYWKTIMGAAVMSAVSLMAMEPALAQDAAKAPPVTPEVANIFNTLLFLVGGWLRDAGSGPCPHQKRCHAMYEKHRPLFHRRSYVLGRWLQLDVHRC